MQLELHYESESQRWRFELHEPGSSGTIYDHQQVRKQRHDHDKV